MEKESEIERERVENLQQQAIVEDYFFMEGKLIDGHNGNTQYRGMVEVRTIVLVLVMNEYWWRNFKYETIEIIMLIAFLIVVESVFAVGRVEENAEFLIS